MEFAVLGSGSAGNCVLVSGGGTRVLIDAGLSLKAVRERSVGLGVELDGVDAILITHEHGDHITHAGRLSQSLDAPLFLGDGTRDAVPHKLQRASSLESLSGHSSLQFGELEVEIIPKSHDAGEPVAFLVHHGEETFGIFSDLGAVDDLVLDAISRCRSLFIEANHDPRLLRLGPYPAYVRQRVGGRLGHLSNDDSARAVARAAPDLGVLVLGHLSAKNNSAQEVRRSFVRHTGEEPGYERWLSLQSSSTALFSGEGKLLTRPVRESDRKAACAPRPSCS